MLDTSPSEAPETEISSEEPATVESPEFPLTTAGFGNSAQTIPGSAIKFQMVAVPGGSFLVEARNGGLSVVGRRSCPESDSKLVLDGQGWSAGGSSMLATASVAPGAGRSRRWTR